MVEQIMESGINLILFLQGLGAWLLPVMHFFSFLGTEEFYLFVAPAIYWCLNATLGLRMGLFLMVGDSLVSVFKMSLHGPRPYWYDTRVQALASETSFGAPSGHAQNAAVVWGTLAHGLKRRWAWAGALGVIILIGLSRLYLGVHFPADVVLGLLVGALVLAGILRLEPVVLRWLRSTDLPTRILGAFGASLALILLAAAARLSLSGWVMPASWMQNATAAFPDTPPDPLALSGAVADAGVFFGLAAGALILQARGGFSAKGDWLRRLARFPIGLVGIALIWYGLGEVFPRGDAILPYTLRYIRYGLVGFWVSGAAPFIFLKIGLADSRVVKRLPRRRRMNKAKV